VNLDIEVIIYDRKSGDLLLQYREETPEIITALRNLPKSTSYTVSYLDTPNNKDLGLDLEQIEAVLAIKKDRIQAMLGKNRYFI
jgi:hypothetical protein